MLQVLGVCSVLVLGVFFSLARGSGSLFRVLFACVCVCDGFCPIFRKLIGHSLLLN
jgi:hypothetical protein